MNHVTAVLSMLHEGPERNSATRLFRSQPVLRWTLRRLRAAASITAATATGWARTERSSSRTSRRRLRRR